MQITLSPELAERIRSHAAQVDGSEVDVIRRALDTLDESFEREVQAIKEGIDAARAGDLRDFAEFDREFRAKHGIPLADD